MHFKVYKLVMWLLLNESDVANCASLGIVLKHVKIWATAMTTPGRAPSGVSAQVNECFAALFVSSATASAMLFATFCSCHWQLLTSAVACFAMLLQSLFVFALAVLSATFGGYVFGRVGLSVCLFVCLWTTLLKKLWTDWDDILWRGPG